MQVGLFYEGRPIESIERLEQGKYLVNGKTELFKLSEGGVIQVKKGAVMWISLDEYLDLKSKDRIEASLDDIEEPSDQKSKKKKKAKKV